MAKLLSFMKSAVVFSLVFFAQMVVAAEFPPAPNPFHYINDYTNTLSSEHKQILENKLIAYSKETSSQIAVVLVPTTGEYEIADYTFALGDKWGIGRKNLNNGVLMLIAKNDRKVFIATGQGLEGVLPDAFLSQVIRSAILPQFKQGQYAQGINDGLNQIIAASKGEFDAAQVEEDAFDKYIPFLMVLAFIAIVLFGEFQYHKDEVYISPNQRDQLNKIIRQSTISRRRGGGHRPGDQGAQPVATGRAGSARSRPAADDHVRGGARPPSGRRVLLQRTGGSRYRAQRGRAVARRPGCPHPLLRNLPGQPDPRPGAGLRHVQARLRPPRRQPARSRPRHRACRDHRAQPRFRGRCPDRTAESGALRQRPLRTHRGLPRRPQRQRRRGAASPRPSGFLRAVPPRGGSGPP